MGDLTDSQLYKKCQEYGLLAQVWKRRFAGLLPEVLKRDLHRRRGFGSIHEFAFKLGGLSSASVDKILHLADKLDDKPVLKAQLTSGDQGWSKIEKVAFIATPETDRVWADRVETMSAVALGAFVQAQRLSESENGVDLTDVGKLENKFRFMQFSVSSEVEKKFRVLKVQLEKERGVTLNYNEVLQVMMERAPGAQVVVQVCPECAERKSKEVKSRSIPASVRRLIQAKYQGFCAYKGCLRAATSLHHTRGYALAPDHDPNFIVPLCVSHERLVHSVL
ncbi:MAG: hypothetical protein AAB802_03770, partial [Patescibacteria group bacterium]